MEVRREPQKTTAENLKSEVAFPDLNLVQVREHRVNR